LYIAGFTPGLGCFLQSVITLAPRPSPDDPSMDSGPKYGVGECSHAVPWKPHADL
jgi:hypothetical protein